MYKDNQGEQLLHIRKEVEQKLEAKLYETLNKQLMAMKADIKQTIVGMAENYQKQASEKLLQELQSHIGTTGKAFTESKGQVINKLATELQNSIAKYL